VRVRKETVVVAWAAVRAAAVAVVEARRYVRWEGFNGWGEELRGWSRMWGRWIGGWKRWRRWVRRRIGRVKRRLGGGLSIVVDAVELIPETCQWDRYVVWWRLLGASPVPSRGPVTSTKLQGSTH
jgi:hypothetical protein